MSVEIIDSSSGHRSYRSAVTHKVGTESIISDLTRQLNDEEFAFILLFFGDRHHL